MGTPPQEGRDLASVALSILMFCSTTNLRILKANDQPESCTGAPEQKKELVDIIQNRRNPTGMVHSGNSGPCETGETASAPPNQPQAVGAVSTKRGSSPGSGAWNALRRLRQRLSRRALSAESPIKQGVELGDSGQFHLPPVFRSSRSASLEPPPAEGREANGAAHERHAR